jgi:ribosomal protein S18 acetylase RimI-like enzyme
MSYKITHLCALIDCFNLSCSNGDKLLFLHKPIDHAMKNHIEIVACDFENSRHCEALIRLMNEYITDEMGGGPPYTEEQKRELVKGLRDHPSKMIFFAVNGHEFVGLANCFVNFGTFSVKPFVNIHDVIVSRQWRNKGIGRKILEKVIKEALRMDCAKVTLEVREDNDIAKHLYDSLGFHDASPRQFYWTKYL